MAEDAKIENEEKAGKSLIQRVKIMSDFFKVTNFPSDLERIILQYDGVDRDTIVSYIESQIAYWKLEGRYSKNFICCLFPCLGIAGVGYGVSIAKYGMDNSNVQSAVIGTSFFPAGVFCILMGVVVRLIESKIKIYELNALKMEVNKVFPLHESKFAINVEGEAEWEDPETLETQGPLLDSSNSSM